MFPVGLIWGFWCFDAVASGEGLLPVLSLAQLLTVVILTLSDSLLPELVPLGVVGRPSFLRPPEGYEARTVLSCRVLHRNLTNFCPSLPLCFLKLELHDGDNFLHVWELLFPHLFIEVWIESALQFVK